MEVTPATFEETDRYWEASNRELRRLLALRGFGLIPNAPKDVTVTVANNMANIQFNNLMGVTESGILLQISGESMSLSFPQDKGNECYMVAHVDGEVEQQVNNTTYLVPRYTYEFCTLNEIDCDCLPFAKWVKSDGGWCLQESYIPPCVSIGSAAELVRLVEDAKADCLSILQWVYSKVERPESVLLHQCFLEMDGCTRQDTPKLFHRALSKMILALSSLPVKGWNLPALPTMERFNSHDMLKAFSPLFNFLHEYVQIISQAPVQEPEEPKEPENIVVWDAEL